MTDVNAWIRQRAGRRGLRQDPGPDLAGEQAAAQRALAESLVAQDVAGGALEGIARIHRGLDRPPDFGGGPRGAPAMGAAPEPGELIREAVRRSRASGGAVDVIELSRETRNPGSW